MELKRRSRAVIANGVIAVLVGVLMMSWPGATAEVVVRIFAGWLALIAVTSIVLAPKGSRTGGLFARAVILVLLAALIFFSPMLFAAFVTIMAGLSIMFFGILGIATSFFLRSVGIRIWWVMTVIGVLGLVLGGFFLAAPQAGITALVFTLAVFIAIVGASLIWLGWKLRGLELQMMRDPHSGFSAAHFRTGRVRIDPTSNGRSPRDRRGDGGPDDDGGGIIRGEIIE